MQTIEVEVRNPHGLHARPAAIFVKTAAGFRSRIVVENLSIGGASGDARSVLTVLGARVSRGHTIRISAEGEDETQAVERLRELVESGIGEPLE